MKKLTVLFMIVLLIMTVAGCRKIGNTESSGYSSLPVQDTTGFTNNDGETEKTNTDTETEESNSTENNSTVNNSSLNSTTSNTSSTSSASGGGNENSNNQNTNSNSAVSSTPSAVEPPAQPESESDEKWIANRVLELLNEERQKIGVHTRQSLPGLTQVAEMRAEQLTVYFSHNWIDENGKTKDGVKYVCTQLKYGRFVDATLFGDSPEYSYYTCDGAENCSGGGGYTKEQIAQSIVDNFKESSGHWQSLMSAAYYYDGIGIAYGQNPEYPDVYWWCNINSSTENYG